ncbi:LPXTG cell wall anchor domain-containing protein [Glycomyces tritici]|uniref:LPXTG cell wall anchor domain-containing protein n=1 Tax=Glycomyces tritici TaxID=2665176 RepID=A0ABT7YIV0_9ACTN|nr:LPXTG cell wall anchor domain-containing protein [Glycomyces tritici]MDN3238559.1 LPXTG cell wall anchor domain-containing protein [Glycomyces tritici]
MNRTLKRVLGLSGSVVLGLAGAVTFASAAQAHHSDYWGTSVCNEDGTWTVTWEATDGTWPGKEDDLTATVKSWTVEGDVSGPLFVEGAALPANGSTDTLKGTQVVSGDVETVSLVLTSKWSNTVEDTGAPYIVSQPEGGCDTPEEPEPGFVLDSDIDCVGIWVWADNTNPEALAEFTFVSSDGEEESYTPEVGEGFGWYFLLEEPESGLSVDVLVDGELVDTVEWYDQELCSYIEVEADCEGLIFTLSVPADGEATTFTLWTSYSDEPEEIVVQPGGSEVREFKAVEDVLWVDYRIKTAKDGTEGGVEWIPCDEETPSPSGTPSAQPQLPTTGSSMTIMIGSAAALIVAAAAIFLIMRRRRAAQDW